jgi:hypothetical protein
MGCNPTCLVVHPIDERAFRVRTVSQNTFSQDAGSWTGEWGVMGWGEDPIETVAAVRYLAAMNLLLLILVLLLLFGGGGFYFGGPVVGGGGLGFILLVCLIIFMMGGFRTRKT